MAIEQLSERAEKHLVRALLATALISGCANVDAKSQQDRTIEVDHENVQALITIAINENLSVEQRAMAIKGLNRYWKQDPSIHSVLSKLTTAKDECIKLTATAVIARQQLEHLECPASEVNEK